MKKVLKILIILLVCVVAFFLLIYGKLLLQWLLLTLERPAGAKQLPDFSGEVTEVRVTGVKRTRIVDAEPMSSSLNGSQAIQIYYGYKMDGEWHDLPCENYDLINFSGAHTGYDAAGWNHIVQIGPFLLISIEGSIIDTGPVLYDTLGTVPVMPFAEYREDSADPFDGYENGFNYCYFRERYGHFNTFSSEDQQFSAPFFPRYYMIVPLDQITDEYVLTYYDKSNESMVTTLTGQRIRVLLDKLEYIKSESD